MLTDQEKTVVIVLAESLTGGSLTSDSRQDSIISNIERRMRDLDLKTLEEYLVHVDQHPDEQANLISSLTIHTTSWFRENPHFVIFHEILLEALKKNEVFTLWCAACSTGEEVYSFGIILEEFRRIHSKFDYKILGTDIDPVSLGVAQRAIYSERQRNFHLTRYKHLLLEGSGKTAEFFTVVKEIRSRCSFRQHDLRNMASQPEGPFHVVLCRNVLIYFSNEGVQQIVRNILHNVRPDGFLFLGHSEAINAAEHGVTQRGHSVFCKRRETAKRTISTSVPQPGDFVVEKAPKFSPVVSDFSARIPTKKDSGPPSTGSIKLSPKGSAARERGGVSTGSVRLGAPTLPMGRTTPYRILSIDDSLMARKTLKKLFSEMGFDSTVVASADEATQYLASHEVDLITLDLQMPSMNGDAWLEVQRREGLKVPVVILSDVHRSDAHGVVQLLARGAQDYMEKEQLMSKPALLREHFLEMVRTHSSKSKPMTPLRGFPSARPEVILIGSSTGGPQALVKLLVKMPTDCPPIVVTQHISPKFTKPLAERVSNVSGLPLGRIETGTPLKPGHLYFAYDDYHLELFEADGKLCIRPSDLPPMNRHRPSVDVMFKSMLLSTQHTMAILLTGMGRDGALGLKALHDNGVFCVAQSEEDCIVYGMPREAIAQQAVDFVGNIDEIRSLILDSLKIDRKRAG